MAHYKNPRDFRGKLLKLIKEKYPGAQITTPDKRFGENMVVRIPELSDLACLKISSSEKFASGVPGFCNLRLEIFHNEKDRVLDGAFKMLCGMRMLAKYRWPHTSFDICFMHMDPQASPSESYHITLSYPKMALEKTRTERTDKLSHENFLARVLQSLEFYHKILGRLKGEISGKTLACSSDPPPYFAQTSV